MLKWLVDTPLRVGTEAPDFTLLDQDGSPHTLSKLRGSNVVLIFYPADETTTCRKQLAEFRDRAPLTASKDTLVFGLNPQSAESHSKFRQNQRLTFPLLVDTGKRVASSYNCGGPLIRRTVYLVGKSGLIRFAQRGKPVPEEVLQAAEL
jgi:peroxiredoxin Q/BCP